MDYRKKQLLDGTMSEQASNTLKELAYHGKGKINLSLIRLMLKKLAAVARACRVCVSHRSQMGSICNCEYNLDEI